MRRRNSKYVLITFCAFMSVNNDMELVYSEIIRQLISYGKTEDIRLTKIWFIELLRSACCYVVYNRRESLRSLTYWAHSMFEITKSNCKRTDGRIEFKFLAYVFVLYPRIFKMIFKFSIPFPWQYSKYCPLQHSRIF